MRWFRYLNTHVKNPMAHKPPSVMRLILKVEKCGPDERPPGGEAVESAPVGGVLAEGTMRVLNLEICGLSWKDWIVGETSRGMLGVAVDDGENDDDDDAERRESIDILIVDETKVVWTSLEVGAKNAICEVGDTSCGLAAAADVSAGASAVFVLDIEEGLGALEVEAGVVRKGFDFWSSG